jgi:hypothetical protein
MDKLIKATELKVGDVMIGFLDRTAEVIEVNTTGRQFVYFKVEGLPRDRVDKYAEIWIRVPDVVDEPEMKKELEGMVNALKKAHSDIKVVWTMKGHYDS